MKLLRASLKSYMRKKLVAGNIPMTDLDMSGISGNNQRGGTSGMNILTYIPQFGDSFLDRLMEMSTQVKVKKVIELIKFSFVEIEASIHVSLDLIKK